MNEGLLQAFTIEEVGTDLNQMVRMKALVLDDFSACFYPHKKLGHCGARGYSSGSQCIKL
jgi:hypothetical protein